MLAALETDIFVSGTFWLTVVIVLLTAGLVAMTVALIVQGRRALKQQKDEQELREKEQERRELSWETTSVPMLRNDARLGGNLAVSWNARPVEKPSIVTFTLRSTGNRDIPSDAFDGGRSIDVNFASVVALLEPEADAKDGLLPVRLVGKTVRIGPGLFKKGEELNIVVLADGDTAATLAEPPLSDVKVRQQQPVESSVVLNREALNEYLTSNARSARRLSAISLGFLAVLLLTIAASVVQLLSLR